MAAPHFGKAKASIKAGAKKKPAFKPKKGKGVPAKIQKGGFK